MKFVQLKQEEKFKEMEVARLREQGKKERKEGREEEEPIVL